MRTLRYESTLTNNETPVIDLFSGNLTTRRYDTRQLIGRCIKTTLADIENLNVVTAAVVSSWVGISTEEAATLTAYAANGVDIYLDATGLTLSDVVLAASQYKLTGVYQAAQSLADATTITTAGLVPACDSASDTGIAHGLVLVSNATPYTENDVVAATNTAYTLAYNTAVRFYINSDPGHWPGTYKVSVGDNIAIPKGTTVAANGIRFVTIADAELVQATGYIDVAVMPIDWFDSIEALEVNAHSLNVTDLYATNPAAIRRSNTALDTTDHFLSYVGGIAHRMSLYVADETDPKSTDVRIYMGEKVNSIDFIADGYTFVTDIGTIDVHVPITRVTVRNELTSVSSHLAGGSDTLKIRTAPTEAAVADTEYVTYANDLVLDRYVQMRSDDTSDTVEITVTLNDDGDRIAYDQTYRMVDQLPQWMVWRTKGSTGFSMTNIAARYIDEIYNADGVVGRYFLQELDDTINGDALVLDVDLDWTPTFGDVTDDHGQLPMAADTDELLRSQYPCYYVSDGRLYVVRYNEINLYLSESTGAEGVADTIPVQNLWTHFDEWGLMVGLRRHTGESITRFMIRILDVFASGFGSHLAGIKAAAARELSPVGMDTSAYSPTDKDSVVVDDTESASLKDADGFPVQILRTAVADQRAAGVHTWGTARAGKSLIDADGKNHKGQGRLPYAYDTPLVDMAAYLSSGSGPKDDLVISDASNIPLESTITISASGYERVPAYTGKRLSVVVEFAITGTHKIVATPVLAYDIRMTATTAGGTYYRDIKGRQRSNVKANATLDKIGYNNTNVNVVDLIAVNADGELELTGTWINNATGKPTAPPAVTDITALTVAQNGTPSASVRYWCDYTDGNNAFQRVSATSDTLTATTTKTSLSGARLVIQVGPFTMNEATTSDVTYPIKPVRKEVVLFDAYTNGTLEGATKVVTAPAITVPPYVTITAITPSIVSVTPIDNDLRLGAGESAPEGVDPALYITAEELDALKALTSVAINGTDAKSFIVTFDEANASDTVFPYAVVDLQQCTSERTVVTPSLEAGQSAVISLQDAQLPALPSGATEVTRKITSDRRGVVATLIGNDLVVFRSADTNNGTLSARRGYYWLAGTEGYYYSDPTTVTVTLNNADTFTLSDKIANFSPVQISDNSGAWSYRFYQGTNGAKVFTATGMPDYTRSFYVTGREIHLSEAVTGDLEVTYQKAIANDYAETGILTKRNSSWEDRFFVVLADGTEAVNSVQISADKAIITAGRKSGGCADMTLVCAKAIDHDGNPVAGQSVTWATTLGTLSNSEATTGPDGRATTYFTHDAVGSATITATIGTKAATQTITIIALDAGSAVPTVVATYPSMLSNTANMRIRLETYDTAGSSSSWTLEYISAEGTKNVEGTWAAATPASGTVVYSNGRGEIVLPPLAEGLYKMTIEGATLVWRIY